MKKENKKVLVGMSGGVDSSVAALLLKKEGYEVVGVFIDFIGGEKSEQDFQRAQKIAKKLKISIYRLDAQKIFKKEIIDRFVEDYKKGVTPNPCVMCNPEMKFKILIEEANKRGIEKVATGHYSRLRREFPISNFQFPNKSQIQNSKLKIDENLEGMQEIKEEGKAKEIPNSRFQISNLKDRIVAVFEKKSNSQPIDQLSNRSGDSKELQATSYKLAKAKDENKDQSYFLYRLSQSQLERILFPLGEYLKSEVREIAEEKGFGIKDEEESQDVCFIADNDFNKFIAEKIPNKPGNIVDSDGNILGKHKGLHFYTIGQRKGINLGGDGPYFVVKKDMANNELVVANNFIESLWRDEFEIKNTSWIKPGLKFPMEANVKIRYRTEEICAIIDEISGSNEIEKICKVKLDQPQKAITPGQSAVFYSKEGEVLGGGIII
ncbi:MAG: tRNA 2-thiouridine(34) synthase MnmA [Candidatus Moranbacteria bacterium]|jgi:tRNA-specific 2-thiouridylase|nr:tRNA 2-thiouridine(34) synthase MnmA [Candidatus Moranbacteria bacterium]